MSRIPEKGSFDEYARFSFDLWEGLNGKYSFYVQRWKRTLEFLRDQHWQTLKEYDTSVLPKWRRFPIQNYTLAFYNDYLTDYLKSEVRFSAVPASAEPSDIDAAELSEQLMKYLWDRLDMDKKKIDLGAWVMATGTGALRVYWDTNTGDQVPLGIPLPGGGFMPVDPETLQPDPEREPEMVDRGEIGVEVLSPQFVRWAENPAHGVMVGLLITYEEAKAFYGRDVADRLSYSDTHEGVVADLNQIEQPGATPNVDDRTLVIQHYLPRSAENPQGLWWTAAQGGSMMIHEAWPLPAGRIPIISFRWIPIPGEKHIGLSPLYGLTFQNKVYEEITARILEWYQRAKPKRLLKAGGGIARGDITDEPYQELVVNAGGEPEDLEVSDAPQGLFRILQLTQNDMTITSGHSFEEPDQISEGVITQRIRSPAHLKPSKAISTAYTCSRASWREVGETLMHYVSKFYSAPRVVAIQGPDKGFLWREFSGKDISGAEGLSATIRVDDVPLYPQNRQNLRDTMIAILQTEAGQILFADASGALDMDRINNALKATGLDVDLDVIDPDVLEARNEQVEFQNLGQGGEPPQVQPWQNDEVHWTEHTKIVKSIRFRAWSDEARAAFLQHIQEHEERLNQQAAEEAEAMVEQERSLRRVREQEELRADVQRKWAESLIDLVAQTTGVEVEDVLNAVSSQQGGSE